MSDPQFVRLAEGERAAVAIVIDGRPFVARSGDSVLTALLLAGHRARRAEFGPGDRAGFCLMGACQDCWVSLADGRRIRACTTPVDAGLSVVTT